MTGIYRANKKGFGFVTVEGEEEDFYVSKENREGALNLDTVEIEPLPESGGHSREARIISVTERANEFVVGVVKRKSKDVFVVPDDAKLPKIKLADASAYGATEGMKVVCRITDYPRKKKHPRGRISEELGYVDEPGVDILSIVKGYKVPIDFPNEVREFAKSVSTPVKWKDTRRRMDLRGIRMVTIDGDDTKDFDDAVSIEKDGEDYILGVHIADVSHYVTEDSVLDMDAKERGTSIYLTDRVIPMLPQVLSNGICSLNQGEDRLALSCIMRIDKKGRIRNYELLESVINVTHRMTYHDVNLILSGNRKLCVRYADMLGDFFLMQDLSIRIRRQRKRRGSVDFDFTESRIKLDENGHAISVEPYERGVSQMMIEDFMLSANETVAMEFYRNEVPFMYRGHGKPDPDKIVHLRGVLGKYGYRLGGSKGDVSSKDLQKILSEIKGRPEEMLLSTLVLRSMQRAAYVTECIGHFGLAAKYYCHFTSPIRRYPDLIVHRIIKDSIHGRLKRKRKVYYSSILPVLAESLSEAEHRAEQMERDVDKMKKAEYMANHIGERYEGVVSGVTSWGMYVTLESTVEGMIPLRLMKDDRYNYVDETHELVGERLNKHFTLGDKVDIIVDSADVRMRTIDFMLDDGTVQPSVSGKAKKHGRKGKKAYRKQQKGKS